MKVAPNATANKLRRDQWNMHARTVVRFLR
jgi:hypothetical protein